MWIFSVVRWIGDKEEKGEELEMGRLNGVWGIGIEVGGLR